MSMSQPTTPPLQADAISDDNPEDMNGRERTAEEWAKLAATWSLKGYRESVLTRVETRTSLEVMAKTVKQWVIAGVVTSVVLGRIAGWLMRHFHLV